MTGIRRSEKNVETDIIDEGDLVKEATTPSEYTVTTVVADTEYSQELPANTKKFTFQCRTANDIRFAFSTGKVATSVPSYNTLKAGHVYFEDNLNLTTATVYVACATTNKVVEIIAWS